MGIRRKNRAASLAEQMIAGTTQHLASGTPLPLASGTFTPAQIAARLQALVDMRADVEKLKAQLQAKLAVEATEGPALQAFVATYGAFLKAAFSLSPDVLADFGLKAKKAPAPLTAEQKVAAVAKRASTRAKRHTMGPRQRLAIKGDVVGITVTPITTADPAAAPAPAGGR